MKFLLAAFALTMTGSVFAQMCEVDLVDNYTNRRITTFRSYDSNDGCKEGMKQCRLEIRNRGQVGREDCIRRNSNPQPQPFPNPQPQPWPQPNPQPFPSNDARRDLYNGETVIYAGQFMQVIRRDFNGYYSLQNNDTWRSVLNNIARSQIAITNGCAQDLCANEIVINIITRDFVTVVGIHQNEWFSIQRNDTFRNIQSNVPREQFAKRQGCVYNRRGQQICVGHSVYDTMNNYVQVVGIQRDGRIVTQSNDTWRTLNTNISPDNVIR